MDPERWQQIEKLFHSAVEMPPEGRGVFLQQACQGDEALRKEIERLAVNETEARQFMESRALDVAARAMGKDQPGKTDLIGQTMLHYRVTEKIGAGGMGEVYRAHDERLKRDVAVKVLPEILTGDSEWLARFDREARLLASLNHPNIAAVHGLEEFGGKRFLVLELVEGKTLAQRLAKGPIPVKESIDIARQIAEALEAAHEKGIIHRDLKPANVKITPDGNAKVLDFGLAKASAIDAASRTDADLSRSPTFTQDGTAAGVILGTAAYMAPEQARGAAVDKRADIWAFGVVFFEMLTGKRLFAGDTISDTLAAVLKTDPDWSLLPADAPSVVRRLLARCLERDPRRRLRDIGDGLHELARAEEPQAEAGRTAKRMFAALVVSGFLILILGIFLYRSPTHPASPGVTTYTDIALPEGHALFSTPAISPDGSTVAFVSAAPSEIPRLYIRRLIKDFEPLPIPGAEGAVQPFFSPDGQHVAYFARDRLYRVSLDGSIPIPLALAPYPVGGGWGDDDSIVFAPTPTGGLIQVKATGVRTEKLLIRPDGISAFAFGHPFFLPGAKELLFRALGKNAGVELLEIATMKRRRILLGLGGNMVLAASGHLLFITPSSGHRGQLLAAPFLQGSAQSDLAPKTVLQDLFVDPYQARAWYSLSHSVTLVYAVGNISRNELVRVDPSGRIASTYGGPGWHATLSLSPDENRVAYAREGRVYVRNLQRGEETLLTTEAEAPTMWQDGFPIWTSDGSRVVFCSTRSGNWDLYSKEASGAGAPEVLLSREFSQYGGSMRKDGTLVFNDERPDTATDIWSFRPGGKPEPWRVTPKQECSPKFSPDGQLIAYASDESERFEIYVSPFAHPLKRIQISTEGGRFPVWSPKGYRLFFRQGTKIMVVDVRPDGSAAGNPRMVFDGGWPLGTFGGLPIAPTRLMESDFAVMSNGDFLMIKADPEAIPTRLRVIFNWLEELKRLVPTGEK
jgi:Tol biopolymer transport system component